MPTENTPPKSNSRRSKPAAAPLARLSLAGLVLATGALLLAVAALFQHNHGLPLFRTVEIHPEDIRDAEDGAYRFALPGRLLQSHRRWEYRGTVLEEGRRAGSPVDSVGLVRREGGGHFHVNDNDNLWFSSTDGSDPRVNGLSYAVRLPVNIHRNVPTAVTALFGIGMALWLVPLLRKRTPFGVIGLGRSLRARFTGPRLRALLLWSAVFALSLAHFTRHSDFSYFYHPDEPKKAFFITETRAQFNHPQLLTTSARFLAWVQGVNECPQEAAEAGRLASAIFSSLLVVFLALAALRLVGPVAAFLVVPLLLYHPGVFEAAHYMKEDPALLMGLGATVLASVALVRNPTTRGALWLGVAAGLAVSGKYIGIIAAPLALAVIWSLPVSAASSRQRLRMTGLFFLGLALVFAIINFDAIRQFHQWRVDFGREMETFGEGHREGYIQVPHLFFQRYFLETLPPVIIALSLWQVFLIVRRPVQSRRAWIVPVGFLLAYSLILCFSRYPYHRYALPAEMLLVWLAACGGGALVAGMVRWRGLARRPLWGRIAGGLVVAVVLAGALMRFVPAVNHITTCFGNDTRYLLFRHVVENLPHDAVIAQHGSIRLPYEERRLPPHLSVPPQTVLTRMHLHEFGTVEDLRGAGVTHIAFSPSQWPETWSPPTGSADAGENAHPAEAFGTILWRSEGPYGYMVASEVMLLELAPFSSGG